MQKIFLLTSLWLFVSLGFLSAQETAWVDLSNAKKKVIVEDQISIPTALSELTKKYGIYFSFDVEEIKKYKVKKNYLKADDFEVELQNVLLDTDLKYKKVSKKNYVVFKTISKKKYQKQSKRKERKGEELKTLSSRKTTSLKELGLQIDLQTVSIQLQKTKFEVKGIVLDENEDPMIGVSVVLKSNPGLGTATDLDGTFVLDLIKEDEVLVFSYIGYRNQEVEVNGKRDFNISMTPDLQTLDEVIVVGFGTQKKRFTTGAISKVNGDELQNNQQSTVEGALQGRVSGVQVTTSDAMAGSPVSVRIRGTSSLVASSEPLYVVDGIPIVTGNFSKNNASGWRLATGHESNALTQLNPADIESIEILKDASAAAIYGSRGSNGVVLITTKKGKQGKTQFDVGLQSGFTKETNRIEMLDGPQYLELAKEAWTNSYNDALVDDIPGNETTFDIANDYEKFWQTILPPGLSKEVAENTSTDWIDEALQNGHFQEMNLSASGGSDKTVFYLGGSFRDEKGIFVGNNFKRYNARVNLDHNPTSFLSMGARAAFTVTDSDIIPVAWAGGLGTAQSQALPFYPIFNEDGTYFNAQTGNNVAAELANTEMNQKGTSILGNVYAQVKFLKNFTLRSEFGVNNIFKKEFYYRSAIIEPEAIATSVLSESQNWNSNNILSYSNVFGKHALDVLGGMNATQNTFFSNVIDGEQFPNPALKNPENAAIQSASINTTQFSFLSFLGRVNYRFDDKYLLGFSIRRDGSSRFGKGNRWGTFPALSLGWILTEESFLKPSKSISFLKLRASVGITGNAEIGNFEYFGSYTTNNYVDNAGIVVEEIDNDNLSWESTTQYDVGFDLGLFQGRIEVGADFYLKETSDLLTQVDVSALSGVSRVTSNIGQLENKGIDLSVTTHNTTGKFKWVTNLNIAYNSNRITDLGGLDFIPNEGLIGGAVAVGHPVGARFSVPWAGIAASDMTLMVTDPDSGDPVEIQVRGGEELFTNQFGETTNIYNPNDQIFSGNPNPVWTGGLNNSVTWKNFDLNLLFTFASGHDLENSEQRFQFSGFGYGWNMWSSAVDRWQQDGDQTEMQRLTWLAPNRSWVSTRVMRDASFVRMKNLSIGYNLPSSLMKKWGLGSFRIYAKGSNLATFSSYPGWDPEYNRDEAGNANQGKSWLPSPQAKSVSFGINVNF